MNISPISSLKLNNIKLADRKYNHQQQNSILKSKNDVFIKSINFTSRNIDKNYEPFKNDLISYILQNDNCQAKEIEKIFQKYSPKTSFKDFSSLPKTTNAHEATAGYTEQKIGFIMGKDGKLQLEKFPQTVYMVFPPNNSYDEKVLLIDRILHEATHVFNSDYSKGNEHEELMSNYIKNAQNIQKTLNTIKMAQQVFNAVEKNSLFILARLEKIGSLPKNIPASKNLEKIFIQNFNLKPEILITKLINDILNNASKLGNFDKNFVLDFVISKADEEKEAYKNALEAEKSLLNIKGKTDFDLRLEVYENIIKSAKKLK